MNISGSMSLESENRVRVHDRTKLLTLRGRPTVLQGKTCRVSTGCCNLYVTINFDPFGRFEIFATMRKAVGCAASQLVTTFRLISLALRTGLCAEGIMKQIDGMRSPSPA